MRLLSQFEPRFHLYLEIKTGQSEILIQSDAIHFRNLKKQHK